MRDVNEVLKEKEEELDRVRREVEALRLAASLISEERDNEKIPPQSVGNNGNAGERVSSWP